MVSARIDLHLHTTASDGRCTPEELVERAFAAGIRVLSVTDHDTRAGERPARAAAQKRGMELISGIEITTVHEGKDVHVLGYGLPPDVPTLEVVFAEQRRLRVVRAREIAARLARLGAPIDIDTLIGPGADQAVKTIARPQIAQCLVAAGHVSSVSEAFERYLDERAPAYVPHQGVSPVEIIELLARHGGVASLAHPARLKSDDLIADLIDAGLRCIEAYHSSHDDATQRHYVEMATRFGLAVSGGSDFHGDGTRFAELFGVVGLPASALEQFKLLLHNARLGAASN